MSYEVLIEYTVVEGMEEEADRARTEFVEHARGWEPDNFRYRVFSKGEAGRQFVHIATIADEATQRRLGAQQWFKTFSEKIGKASGGTVTATRLGLRLDSGS